MRVMIIYFVFDLSDGHGRFMGLEFHKINFTFEPFITSATTLDYMICAIE